MMSKSLFLLDEHPPKSMRRKRRGRNNSASVCAHREKRDRDEGGNCAGAIPQRSRDRRENERAEEVKQHQHISRWLRRPRAAERGGASIRGGAAADSTCTRDFVRECALVSDSRSCSCAGFRVRVLVLSFSSSSSCFRAASRNRAGRRRRRGEATRAHRGLHSQARHAVLPERGKDFPVCRLFLLFSLCILLVFSAR